MQNTREHVLVSVKDTGSGIDPEMVSKLLSKFTTKSLKGTGLGLYLQEYLMGKEYGLKIIITRMELLTEMELRAKEQHFSSHCLLTMANRSH